jgi:hypothetical protein
MGIRLAVGVPSMLSVYRAPRAESNERTVIGAGLWDFAEEGIKKVEKEYMMVYTVEEIKCRRKP